MKSIKQNEMRFCNKISNWYLIARTEKYALETWTNFFEDSKNIEKYGLKDYKGIKTVLLKLSLNLRGDTFDSENKSFYISIIYGYYIGERYLGYYCCLFDYESSEILDDIFALGGELSELFI